MDITIVIPVYNRKEYVRKTIENIDHCFPLVLVDNGSTDGSALICSAIATERPNTLFLTEPKPGAASARNKGLSVCTTPWVYFFDSDDSFTGLPEKWNEVADIVFFPTRMESRGKVIVRDYSTLAKSHVQILNSMFNTPGMIFSTDFLKRIGGWNESCLIWNDWELGLRALLHNPLVEWKTTKPYHIIKLHPDSITGSSLSSRVDKILHTLNVAFDDIYNADIEENEKKKTFTALFYRSYILSGKMLFEGNIDSSDKVLTFIYDRFRVNKQSHRMGRLFQWATSKGVRGVWRIALRIV